MPGLQIQFSGQTHADLVAASEARLTLQGLFDATGILAPSGLKLTIRDRSVEADGIIHLRIHSDQSVTAFEGQLIWERAIVPAGRAEFVEADFVAVDAIAPHMMRYSGPEAEALMLRLKAPSTTGIYRLVLKVKGGPEVRSEAFVVRPN